MTRTPAIPWQFATSIPRTSSVQFNAERPLRRRQCGLRMTCGVLIRACNPFCRNGRQDSTAVLLKRLFRTISVRLAWDLLERGLRTKRDRPMASLYFRRGTVLGVRGNLDGARKEFLAALDEASRETDINAQHEVIVVSHDALGVLAWTANDYREALRWFQMAEEEQARFGGRWVADITAKRQQMEKLIASTPGS